MLNNILSISLILSFVTTLIVYFIINRNKDKNNDIDNMGKSISYFIFIFIIFIIIFYLVLHIYKINTIKINTIKMKDIKKVSENILSGGLKRVNSFNNIITGLPDF